MKRRIKHALKTRVKHALETLGAYIVYGVFWLLPLDAASAAGAWVMRRLGMRFGISNVARRNLDLAFPEKSLAEREEILGGMWENLGRVIAEYPHLHHIWNRVEIVGSEHILQVQTGGKPAIFFGGHLANWEVCPMASRRFGLSLHLVYRKPNNSGVDGLLRYARSAGATGHIEKGAEGARQIISILKQGGSIAMLMDQKLNEGVGIDFFGRKVMTAPAIAYFALKLNCALLPVQIERLTGAHFRMTVSAPLTVTATGEKEKDIAGILNQVNSRLEAWIRVHPEQWLWIHRRWG
jgi:KDO2-lipid IV(A) lauroyltransferase